MKSTRVIFFFLSICLLKQSNADRPGLRIAGGRYAADNEFPHQVALLYNGNFICGGSIISPTWVLTAARCVKNKAIHTLMILAGTATLSANGTKKALAEIIIHEKYSGRSGKNFMYDVALLRVKDDFLFSKSTNAIELLDVEVARYATDIIITGWGKVSPWGPPSNRLKMAPAFLNSWKSCFIKELLKSTHFNEFPTPDLRGLLCLSHNENATGVCIGDHGSGAIYMGKLAGVADFVTTVCEAHRMRTGYIKVPFYIDWVKNMVGDLQS